MILLDNSVIFTGLPSIRTGLDLGPATLSWVQDAYTLVFGGLLLLGARAGDLVGRRRLFVIGLAIFGAASLLIGLAPTGWWMIAARAVQGIGAAIVAPTSLALITAHFGGQARTRAVAWYGMGALVFGIIESSERGWTSPVTVTGLVIGVVLLVALVVHESRAEQPIMPLRLFGSRERSGAYATRMLYMGAMIGFFYFTTQYLQDALGFSPLQAGLGFLPMTAVNFAVAMAIPRLTAHLPRAVLLLGGVAATFAGMAWLSQLGVGDTYLEAVALPMLLIGAGQGLAFAPLTSSGIAGVPAADAGAASGLLNTAHQLGMALGLGILVTVSTQARPLDGAASVTAHVRAALTGSTVLLAVALIVVVLVIVPIRRTPTAAPVEPILAKEAAA